MSITKMFCIAYNDGNMFLLDADGNYYQNDIVNKYSEGDIIELDEEEVRLL